MQAQLVEPLAVLDPPAGSRLAVGTRIMRLSWKEARPVVQAIFQIRFAAGFVLAQVDAGVRVTPAAVAAAVAWLCATWVVYLLNGISDVAADRRNGGSRPLARGELSTDAAAHMCVVLAVVALVTAATVATTMVLLVVAMMVLGWLYSMGTKPQKANLAGFCLVVVGGGLLTYLAGCQAAGPHLPRPELVIFAGAMSTWMALAGNTKDLADLVGDRATGRRTLPVLLGDRRARWAMAGLVGTLAAAFVVVAWLVEPVLLPAALLLAAGAAALIVCLHHRFSTGARGRMRRPYKVFMITQYAINLTVMVTSLH